MHIKPSRLQKGDTVGIIAPASPPDQLQLEIGIKYLEQMGLSVKKGRHLFAQKGYLAASDDERVSDLHDMFLDNEVKAIISACGGYGTGRIASLLDYNLIQKHPKIFWGYSDLTFLHTSIRQNSNLVTFHGPMVSSDMGKATWNSVSSRYFQQLFNHKPVVYDEQVAPIETAFEGSARGELVGGNLCLLVSTLGTPFEIETDGKILFLEDINEEPRNIDRMLNQLWMAGKLSDVEGIILGDFCDCTPGERAKSFTLQEVLDEYVKKIGKPAISGLKIGHCSPNVAIPLGTTAEFNTGTKRLLIESGLSSY